MTGLVMIPDSINGVKVSFAETVVRNVAPRMLQALTHVLHQHITPDLELTEVYISSAFDSHAMPSRHAQAKAVDLSRVNGKKMSVYYNNDPFVSQLVYILQRRFETFEHRRENFGPAVQWKLGEPFNIVHDDHIHWSVN